MKKLFKRKENGDIALIAVFASILILTILALIIDFGLLYFQSARLQNAVDSATVAVAHNLMDDDQTIKQTVETYMKENGVDLTEKGTGTITSGKLRTKITYGDSDDPKAVVIIDRKGLLTEESLENDDGKYITSGYLKVTAGVNCKAYWAAFSGVSDHMLAKSGYAKCDMQYNEMPEALKYTIFANSSVKNDDYRNMAIRINGRTNNTQEITNIFVNTINKINSGIIQPIIGWVGGTPNYNDLINANLSMAVVNGDVHSNSDISIGVNGLQASRSKDQDFDGTSDECICQSLCTEDLQNSYCTVCQENYKKCEGDRQTGDDDYGQVHFTAVNKIDFSAGKIANNSLVGTIIGSTQDLNTRVYVRNYQYVEETQVALYVINQLDFDRITSTESLRNEYTRTATEYLQTSINIPQAQQSRVLAQADNLQYDAPNKYSLKNQKSIVYAATNAIANSVMTDVQSGKTLSDYLQKVSDSGIDQTGSPESLLLYDGTNFDYENSTITFTKTDSDQTAELKIIDTEVTNRSVSRLLQLATEINPQTEAGYRFAIAKTFKQYSDYVEVPNMKPYFIRAVNRSVRNATVTKNSDSELSQTDSAVSVKDAVKKSQNGLEKTIALKDTLATVENKDGTFSKSAADATTVSGEVPDGQADTYVDNSFSTSESLTNVKTSPLLKYRLTSTDSSGNSTDYSTYTLKKYKASDAGHTTYNGVNIYDASGNLNSAKNVVKEYADKNSDKYGKNAVQKFAKSDVLVDTDYDDSSVHDYEKHYGDDAVAKKKHYIENTLMLSSDSKFSDSAPDKDSVFLMSSGTKKNYLEQKIKGVKDVSSALEQKELVVPADLRTEAVASNFKTLIEAVLPDLEYTVEQSTGVSYSGPTASISKDYTKADGTKVSQSYLYEDLLPGQDGVVKKAVDQIVAETRNDFKMTREDIGDKINEKYNENYVLQSTSGWNTSGGVNKIGSDYSEGSNWEYTLKDKTVYNGSIDNPWRPVGKYYGIKIPSGYSVQVNGDFYANDGKGSAYSAIGDNSDSSKSTYLYVTGSASVNRGNLYIGDNTTVIVDGHLFVGGGHSLVIGKNSKVIVKWEIIVDGSLELGENSILTSTLANSDKISVSASNFTFGKGSQVYAMGDIRKTGGGDASFNGKIYCQRAIFYKSASGNMNFGENAQAFLGRDLSTDGSGDLNLAANAIVVANTPDDWDQNKCDTQGVVRATNGHKITMQSGSIIATQGDLYQRVDASSYDCKSGSLIITDMVKCGNSSGSAKFSNLICKKIDVPTLEFYKNAHVFVQDEIWIISNKTVTITPGTKLLLGKNSNGESVSGNSSFNFSSEFTSTSDIFAIGATGKINGLASGDYTLYNGSYLSASGLQIGSLTINQGGGFCVPKNDSITVTNLTVNDGASTYIGKLNVTNLTVNKDFKVNEITSAKQITVNSGKLLVETNCNVENITNKSNVTVTNKLTVTGKIENNGKILIGAVKTDSNEGITGEIDGANATVDNYNTLQVYGSANIGTLNNKYNTAQSRGSVAYVSGAFTVGSLLNEDESKLIGNGSVSASNLDNSGNIQVKDLTVTANLNNKDDATIKTVNTITSSGSAQNHGKLEANGNASFAGGITNSGELKLNGTATVSGTLNNTGKIQVTSYGLTSVNIANSGEMSVAGGIASTGTVTNSNFICSNGDCSFANLTNDGTVSVSHIVSNSNITNNPNAIVEIFGTGSTTNSIAVLVNNGEFVTNSATKVSNLTNGGKIESFGALNPTDMINTGKVYAHASIISIGTITNNSNGKTGDDASIIYVGGSSSVLKASYLNNASNLLVDGGNIDVQNKFCGLENSVVCVNGGGISTNDFELYANCSLKYDDKLEIKNKLINKTNLALTEITAKQIQNEGNLYISGDKDFAVNYIYNKSGANFAFDNDSKDLIVESQTGSLSVLNEGNMYVKGDMICHGAVSTTAGEMYVYGDIDAANSIAYNSAALNVENSAEVYIYGSLPANTAGNGLFVKANADANAVKARVSIFGKADSLLSSKMEIGRINCEQSGANVFIGNDVKVIPDNNTQNLKGNMFVYGKYECDSEVNFNISDSATLYIQGNVNAPQTTVYLTNQSGLYCFGSEVIFKNITSNSSRVYLVNLPSGTYYGIGKVDLQNVSLIYYPKTTALSNLVKSDDSVVMSDPSGVFPISNSNFAVKNSAIVTMGNIKITGKVTIPEGSTLCVGGNIYFCGTSAEIINNGNLYVMGKMYYSANALATITLGNFDEISDRYSNTTNNSFDSFVTMGGQNADLFVAKTKSGTLKFNKELNLYGNQTAYYDNDIIVTDYLGNSERSKGGINGNDLVPNRGESIIAEGNSKICVSGDIFSNGTDNNLGNAVYVGSNASLSCGQNFYSDSALYNYGKFYVFGEFVNYKKADGTEASNSRQYASDKGDDKHYEGYSIKNGDSNNHNASIYIGGVDHKGKQSTNTIIFEGFVQNYGKINIMQAVYIKGHKVTSTLWMRTVGENNEAVYATRYNRDSGSKYENAPRASIVAEEYSRANFGSNVAMLGGYITFNKADSIGDEAKCPVFSAEGDATYGMCIINGGIFYAKGEVGYTGDVGHTKNTTALGEKDKFSDYYIHHLEIFYRNGDNLEGDKKGSYSIVNGYVFYDSRNGNNSAMNTNALFYAGSGVQVGTSENAGSNDIGGTVQNYGKMYLNGSLTVYSNAEYAISYIAISAQKGSTTAIAGDCWSSGGTVTMRNSLLMCDGNFMSKRCVRIGASEQVNSNDDLNSSSYLYVGGNMVTSTFGTGGKGDLAGNIGGASSGNSIATWNYMDVFSNASIYVGGSFFTNSIFHPHKNVTLIVDGKNKGGVNTATNFITWLQKVVNGLTLSINGYDYDDFKFIVNNRFDVQQTLREGRTKSMFNRFYVHGSAFLNGRAKISDMTKFYVYGDFVNRTDAIAKITAFEIGRALNTSDDGDTWASKGTFIDENDEPRFVRNNKGNLIQNPDYDYNYANACYVYVKGKFDLDRKVNIYPGTTIRTGKDYAPRGMVKLMHDTAVYSGGKISTHRYIDVGQYSELFAKDSINAWNYVCVREHGTLYSGGDVKCGTTFEGKTYSTIYSCGSIKATLSNIKIRDNTTVFCGGNMTALSYIELGKHDEKYKDSLREATPKASDNVCTCTGRCTKDDADGDCPVCKNDYTKCTAPLECICSTKCADGAVNADCPACSEDWHNCEAEDPDSQEEEICTCTDKKCDKANPDCPVCKNDFSKCQVTNDEAEELTNDLLEDYTDTADGGEFYIGKALCAYTGYIRQYGFSSTTVGKYVFANKYVTLRSNADMWVLPEAYNNDTYHYVAPSFESDGTILGNIVKYLKEFSYNLKDKLSFKNGSVYAMGDLTLNKNASLMGTHDMRTFGKTLLCHDSLMYFGHDIKCSTASLKLIDGIKGNGYTGFKATGDIYTTLRCTNKAKHPNGYTIYTKDYDPNKTYKCDRCGAILSKKTVKENVTCPVTMYANNEIDISTSTDMTLCYMVACNGDVTISDPFYNSSDNDARNLYQLPNAIASYNGNINYSAIYGKISALFYAPVGDIKFDGFYQEIWGSIIGNTVSVDTFYINLHRFSNWRTMNLEIAEAGSVYLISEDEYEKQVNNVDESYLHTGNSEDETAGGASLFFDRDLLNNGTSSGQGTETDTTTTTN